MAKKYAILHVPSGTYLKEVITRHLRPGRFEIAYFTERDIAYAEAKHFVSDSDISRLWIEDQISYCGEEKYIPVYTCTLSEFEIVEVK